MGSGGQHCESDSDCHIHPSICSLSYLQCLFSWVDGYLWLIQLIFIGWGFLSPTFQLVSVHIKCLAWDLAQCSGCSLRPLENPITC